MTTDALFILRLYSAKKLIHLANANRQWGDAAFRHYRYYSCRFVGYYFLDEAISKQISVKTSGIHVKLH